MEPHTDSEFVSHIPCEKCGSSDANSLYTDGHTFCFSCQKVTNGVEQPEKLKKPRGGGLIEDIEFRAIPKRKLDEETCRKWGYGFGTNRRGTVVQVANYYDTDGVVVAQKIRGPNKDFKVLGDAKNMGLYGRHLWTSGGKRLVVTEGELDALSVSQVQENRWPVVSIPNGVQSAEKAFRAALTWLETFETVVIMFDMDEPGQKAAKACAALLSPGKAAIARLPKKDASDCLQEGLEKELINAMWRAEVFRPDGILDAEAVRRLVAEAPVQMPLFRFPLKKLDEMTGGVRRSEIVLIGSGTGMGKTEFAREIAIHASLQGLNVGYVALEESVQRTYIGIAGMLLGVQLKKAAKPVDTPGYNEVCDKYLRDKWFFYDHFGSLDEENLIAKLRYLRIACRVDLIVLDHISIVVSGLESDDERRTIDHLMTRCRSLTQETGVAMIMISHMNQPEKGAALEEGGKTSIHRFRGSRGIGQLIDTAIGLERNQQADDEEEKNVSTIRLLKCRFSGDTGFCGKMRYDKVTGRLHEVEGGEVFDAQETTDGKGDY